MESPKRDGTGDLAFFLDLLAQIETARRMVRVAFALGLEAKETDGTPINLGFMRRTVTASIPDLLTDAERAGIPADALSTAAVEAWAQGTYRDAETRAVLGGPWNYQEDVPQWMVDGTSFSERILGNRSG